MSGGGVLRVTVGPGRVGKTARVVRWLITYYLPYDDGVLWTNLPLKRQEIAKLIAPMLASRLGVSEEIARADALRRIQIIPGEVLDSWEWHGPGTGECPGRWFEGKLGPGDLIVLDECHRYIPIEADSADKELVHEWRTWVGELGHPGAALELLSQGQWKFSEKLREEATTKYQLSHVNEEQDEMTGIKLGDWWQLIGKLGGKSKTGHWPWYRGGWREDVWERRNNKFETVLVDGQPFHIYRFESRWFDLYDSQAKKPGQEGGFVRAKLPFERLTWFWFMSWFLQRNYKPVSKWVGIPTAVVIGGFVMWNWGAMFLQGGLGFLNRSLGSSSVAKAAAAPTGPQSASLLPSSASPPVPSAAAVASAVAKETVERVMWDTAIVLMSERHVIFRNRALVRVGEKVQNGSYAGRKLVRVDLVRRIAQLDNGVVVQLNVSPTPSQTVPTKASGDMGAAKPGRPANGPGRGPEPDPKFSGAVGPGPAGSGGVPVVPGAAKPAGAGGAGSGVGRIPTPAGGDGRLERERGAATGQAGNAGQRVINRTVDTSGAPGDRSTGDAVRAGVGLPTSDVVVPGKRQR